MYGSKTQGLIPAGSPVEGRLDKMQARFSGPGRGSPMMQAMLQRLIARRQAKGRPVPDRLLNPAGQPAEGMPPVRPEVPVGDVERSMRARRVQG